VNTTDVGAFSNLGTILVLEQTLTMQLLCRGERVFFSKHRIQLNWCVCVSMLMRLQGGARALILSKGNCSVSSAGDREAS